MEDGARAHPIMPSTDWQLFVDESGDFRDPTKRVCVAGVLLALPEHEDLTTALRALLERAFPLSSYPPHATLLNLAASRALFALAARARGRAVELPDTKWEAVDAAIAALRTADDDAVVEALRAAERGLAPGWEHARACEAWLTTNAPAAARGLRDIAELEDQHLRDTVFGLLAQVLEGNEGDGPATPWAKPIVVVAAEASPPASPKDDEDRYLDLLETLFERVYALLRSTDGVRRHVIAHIAERPLWRDDGKRMLGRADVAEASKRAARLSFLQSSVFPDPKVWMSTLAPCRFDEAVHPGVVLADFAANRVGRALRDDPKREHDLQRRVQAALGDVGVAMRPLSRPQLAPLPTAATSGSPRSHVARALEGERVDFRTLGDVRPEWAADQAQRWQAAAAKLRGDA